MSDKKLSYLWVDAFDLRRHLESKIEDLTAKYKAQRAEFRQALSAWADSLAEPQKALSQLIEAIPQNVSYGERNWEIFIYQRKKPSLELIQKAKELGFDFIFGGGFSRFRGHHSFRYHDQQAWKLLTQKPQEPPKPKNLDYFQSIQFGLPLTGLVKLSTHTARIIGYQYKESDVFYDQVI